MALVAIRSAARVITCWANRRPASWISRWMICRAASRSAVPTAPSATVDVPKVKNAASTAMKAEISAM